MCTEIAPNHSKLYFSFLETLENTPFLFDCCQHTEPWTKMEPLYDWSSDPPLSAKGPFVRFDPADLTIRGYKAKTDYRNIILEIWKNFPSAQIFCQKALNSRKNSRNLIFNPQSLEAVQVLKGNTYLNETCGMQSLECYKPVKVNFGNF